MSAVATTSDEHPVRTSGCDERAKKREKSFPALYVAFARAALPVLFFLGCLVQSDGATRLSLPPGPKQPRHSEGRLPELGGLFRQHEGVSSTSGDLYRQAEDSGLRPQQGEGSGVLESRLRHQRPKVPEVPPNQAETEHRQARAYRRQVHAGACRTSSWAHVIELVFTCPMEEQNTEGEQVPDVSHSNFIMAIDLGVDNLATMVTTTGLQPVIVKGRIVKAINQYYNKMKAHYTSILRQGKNPREGTHTSKRLERLHLQRHRLIKDLFHKASHHIVRLAEEQRIGTIVIGHNAGWKQESAMGRRNNQSFCHLPHKQLIAMIQYKAAAKGITVILTEEAYTSKASFLDQDPLPRFGEGGTYLFSGKRIYRGLYASQAGVIHADVNGAANIMRKVFPNVSAKPSDGIEGLDGNQSINVSTPRVLSILKPSG